MARFDAHRLLEHREPHLWRRQPRSGSAEQQRRAVIAQLKPRFAKVAAMPSCARVGLPV